MDCPQCGAEVPSDDTFCGKCGYARRDHGPERLDQSRIRMHEEPDPSARPEPERTSSEKRIRKHTVLGMPTVPGASPVDKSVEASPTPPPPPSAPPPVPTPLSAARSGRTRTPQKTMLGIPRPDFAPLEPVDEPSEAEQPSGPVSEAPAASEPAPKGHRVRARVRYDSANEPLPATARRKKALRGLALLVILSAAWLGYRFLTLDA